LLPCERHTVKRTAGWETAFTASGDLTIKLWDMDKSTELERPRVIPAQSMPWLSADSRRLLSASFDGSARLWDTAGGEQISMFDPGTGPIIQWHLPVMALCWPAASIARSADGRSMAAMALWCCF